jgi:hypothetical protein
VSYPCSLPTGVSLRDTCFFTFNDCALVCPSSIPLVFNCHSYGDWCVDAAIVDASNIIVECATCANGVGRRPQGLAKPRRGRSSRSQSANALGNYFAGAAHLEAASIPAFRMLRRELARHGAPRELLEAADNAGRDEVRHARSMARLAKRFGVAPNSVVVRRSSAKTIRSLEAFAIDNAIEGCARETFGALVATWQANHARDPEIASAMREIAEDETKHAALAWATARFVYARLKPAEKTRATRAFADALTVLEEDVTRQEPHPDLVTAAGMPHTAIQRLMARGLVGDGFHEAMLAA